MHADTVQSEIAGQGKQNLIVSTCFHRQITVAAREINGFTQSHRITCTTLCTDVKASIVDFIVQISNLTLSRSSVYLDVVRVVLGVAQSSNFTCFAINRYRVRAATDIDDACADIGGQITGRISNADAVGAVRGIVAQGIGHFGTSGGQIGDVAVGVGQH